MIEITKERSNPYAPSHLAIDVAFRHTPPAAAEVGVDGMRHRDQVLRLLLGPVGHHHVHCDLREQSRRRRKSRKCELMGNGERRALVFIQKHQRQTMICRLAAVSMTQRTQQKGTNLPNY